MARSVLRLSDLMHVVIIDYAILWHHDTDVYNCGKTAQFGH